MRREHAYEPTPVPQEQPSPPPATTPAERRPRVPAEVLGLQRSIGNHATNAIIARQLSDEDRATFEKRLRAHLGLKDSDELPGPLARMFENACKRLSSLAEVDEWFKERSSLIAGYGKTGKAVSTGNKEDWDNAKAKKAEREAAQPSLAAWVAPDSLAGKVNMFAGMDGDWTVGGQDVPIVWTAGAASCVAVALYLPGRAALCHLDPGKIGEEKDPLPEGFVKKLYEFNGCVVHLAAGQMDEFLLLLRKKINALPQLAFASVTTHKTTRLALNARDGRTSTAFNTDELMAILMK